MRLFIASADQALRLALLMLLESEPGMVVVGMSDRLGGLPIQVGASCPEVLLLDYGVSQKSTTELVRILRRLECHPKVVVFSSEAQMKAESLEAGAEAFISKNSPADELLPILRRLRASESDVSMPPV